MERLRERNPEERFQAIVREPDGQMPEGTLKDQSVTCYPVGNRVEVIFGQNIKQIFGQNAFKILFEKQVA